MLVHTHVYYSNRFEPGTLFPDTFRIDRSELLGVKDATIVTVYPLDKEIGLESFRDIKSTERASLNIEHDFGYALLYIMVPSKDFNLNESMDATGGALAFDSLVHQLDGPESYSYTPYNGTFVFDNKIAVTLLLNSITENNALFISSHQLTVI